MKKTEKIILGLFAAIGLTFLAVKVFGGTRRRRITLPEGVEFTPDFEKYHTETMEFFLKSETANTFFYSLNKNYIGESKVIFSTKEGGGQQYGSLSIKVALVDNTMKDIKTNWVIKNVQVPYKFHFIINIGKPIGKNSLGVDLCTLNHEIFGHLYFTILLLNQYCRVHPSISKEEFDNRFKMITTDEQEQKEHDKMFINDNLLYNNVYYQLKLELQKDSAYNEILEVFINQSIVDNQYLWEGN